jgi:hypothetical protein
VAALSALTLYAGAAPAQDKRTPPPDRDRLEASTVPRLPPEGLLPALVAPLQPRVALALVRGAAGVVEGALRQAEGAIVPITPDAVLGRERDPLGKGAP